MTFVIVTDSASDTPEGFKQRDDVFVAYTSIIIEGKEYLDNELSISDLLDKFSQGLNSTTSMPSPAVMKETYDRAIASGLPVLGIHVSSRISGTFNGAKLAVDENGADVVIFDTLNATVGSGYFVMLACRLKDKGYDRETILALFQELKPKVHLELLFNDIDYLRRGGRVNLGQY